MARNRRFGLLQLKQANQVDNLDNSGEINQLHPHHNYGKMCREIPFDVPVFKVRLNHKEARSKFDWKHNY